MTNFELFSAGAVCGFLLSLIVCSMAFTSDWRGAEVISEYKSGKIICMELDGELICRRKQ